MELVTVDQIKQIVKDRGLTVWHVRDCKKCGYPTSYEFFNDVKTNAALVRFDGGCNCVNNPRRETQSYDPIVEFINNNLEVEGIKEFWGLSQ